MATVKAITNGPSEDGVVSVVWEGLNTNDELGAPSRIDGRAALSSVHVKGVFDSASISLIGSNDGATGAAIAYKTGEAGTQVDNSRVNMVVTAEGVFSIENPPLFIWPAVGDAGASTDVDVILVYRTR